MGRSEASINLFTKMYSIICMHCYKFVNIRKKIVFWMFLVAVMINITCPCCMKYLARRRQVTLFNNANFEKKSFMLLRWNLHNEQNYIKTDD